MTKTLNEIVEKAREQEIELDLRTKQKPKQVHTEVGQAKILRPLTLPVGASNAVASAPSTVGRTVGFVDWQDRDVMSLASRAT